MSDGEAAGSPLDALRAVLPRPVRRVLGRLGRSLASVPTRVLHPWRRRRALRKVRSVLPADSVLFVCKGNVCRSPYAERVFRNLLGRDPNGAPDVRSAGFIGPGRPPPERAVEVARARGVDTADHRSRTLGPKTPGMGGLVVVMNARQARKLRRRFPSMKGRLVILGDLDPRRPRRRGIEDPWSESPETFHRVFRRIERCVATLARACRGKAEPAAAVSPKSGEQPGLRPATAERPR